MKNPGKLSPYAMHATICESECTHNITAQFLAIFHGIQLVGDCDYIRAVQYFGLAVSFYIRLIAAHFCFCPVGFPLPFRTSWRTLAAVCICILHWLMFYAERFPMFIIETALLLYIYLFYSKLVSLLFIVVVVEVARKRGQMKRLKNVLQFAHLIYIHWFMCDSWGALIVSIKNEIESLQQLKQQPKQPHRLHSTQSSNNNNKTNENPYIVFFPYSSISKFQWGM